MENGINRPGRIVSGPDNARRRALRKGCARKKEKPNENRSEPGGRILSVILGIYGIVAVALITSIIVNYYGEMKKADPDRPDQQKES